MKHTLTEIVKNSNSILTHVCNGIIYYSIKMNDGSIYQFPIDSANDEDCKNVFFVNEMKSIHLMRWIRESIEDDKLIQLI